MAANAGRITLALVVALALGATVALMAYRLIDARQAPPIVITDTALERTVTVMVDGAVLGPGTFELPPGARLHHAIDAAGGTLTDAQLGDLNMARLLVDGERITVPRVELASVGTPPAVVFPADAGGLSTTDGDEPVAEGTSPVATVQSTDALVNINTADAVTLEALPGIGPALAARIITYRTDHGAFISVDQLDDVSGISPRMVDELRELITV
ncbi:MAG TPA: ComEA family DNA-binding protein [Thermomicrobiales bacterium]|jgi:competence protein ComEA|nr:ComEA family DNA-binding protein [Thermomicrobiales bacterium]